MKKSLIYTKTGDAGTTSLVGGIRASKTHARLEAYGSVDELNSFIGMLVSSMEKSGIRDFLLYIQHKLFAVGSYLATDVSKTDLNMASCITEEDISRIENEIDIMDLELPSLKGFVLPGGCMQASMAHICRTVCRRCERRILELEENGVCEIDVRCKSFVNRLSDYFFVLSRKLNHLSENEEIYWDKSCK